MTALVLSRREALAFSGLGVGHGALQTRHDYAAAACRASSWVRQVVIEPWAGDGIVRVRVRGPLGLRVPVRAKKAVAEAIEERAPIGARVRVTA